MINGEPFYKLIQGDCLEILPTLKPQSVHCVVADLPYNVKIASWDNIKNYECWLLQCFKAFERVLKPNGTLWFFHMNFPVISRLNANIEKETSFRFKQFITINKGLQSIAGRCSDNLRSYPRATEYLLFYTFGELTDTPMAQYLRSEIDRAKATEGELRKLFRSKNGNPTGCASNWLQGKNFPTKEQYLKVRNYLNDSRKSNTFMIKSYEDLLYTFNMESGVTDVWDFSFYEAGDGSHPTIKPVKLIKRIIETSTNKGDVVLDPTAGSGSTIKACKDLKRSCIAIEKSAKYSQKIKSQIINQTELMCFNISELKK